MREHVERHFGFLKTTLLGGVVFLLPLAVVGWLLAQVGQIVWGVVVWVQEFLRSHENDAIAQYAKLDTTIYLLLLAASLVGLVGFCFFCGMIARRSLGRWFTDRAERYLTMLFPRYAVFKDQLTGNLGTGTLRPVVARVGPSTRIGMEVERSPEGVVTVYLPSAPDPWSGTIELVAASDVTPIPAQAVDVMTTFEQLGRGSSKHASAAGVKPHTERGEATSKSGRDA